MVNKLDKLFGPTGTTAGIVIFVAGLIMMYYSFSALILVLLGAFVGFTFTAAIIDPHRRRVKYAWFIFGMWPTGKWIAIDPEMKLGIRKSNEVWRTYSRTNQILDIPDRDYRVLLYDIKGKVIMPLIKAPDKELARQAMEEAGKLLGIRPVQP